MTDQNPSRVPRARGLKASGVITMAALVDLLVVPYSYWRLNGHRLALIVTCAVEGMGVLSLLGIALYLRRRGG